MSQSRFEVEMIKRVEERFLDYFKDLEDPRSTRDRLYSMSEILLATLSAAICGAEGWEHIAFLKQYLPYKSGVRVERCKVLYQLLISGLVKEPMTPPIAIRATIQMIKESLLLFSAFINDRLILVSRP